jgi:hypothetical protein
LFRLLSSLSHRYHSLFIHFTGILKKMGGRRGEAIGIVLILYLAGSLHKVFAELSFGGLCGKVGPSVSKLALITQITTTCKQ